MNTNAIHNVLNFVGLLVGIVVTTDFVGLGFSAETAALVAGWALVADKVIKILMNITRDGVGGLFAPQPPVKK